MSRNKLNIYDDMKYEGWSEKGRFQKVYPHIKDLKNPKIIDIGGGNGNFHTELKKHKKDFEYTLTDFSDGQLKLAKKKGLNVKKVDFSKKFPLKTGDYDVIIICEVIEHVFDTLFLLKECNRILKKGGLVVLTTPNTAAIGNRFALLKGKRPGCIDYRAEANGHIRVFVKKELDGLFKEAKFEIVKSTGTRQSIPLLNRGKKWYKLNYIIADMFPTLSAGLMVIARKK